MSGRSGGDSAERARDWVHGYQAEVCDIVEPLSSISAPTLVIHGDADPMFPLEHGRALAEAIPGAQLLTLDGGGHGIYRSDWETVARAILEHTGAATSRP